MSRQRITWALKTQPGKTAEKNKQASPPPQMPAVDRTEPPSHPAYYPDPEIDKYEKGNTSEWAEDPHIPTDPESPPPAMPGNLTTEPLTHPATSEFQKKPESPEQAAAAGGGGGKKAHEEEKLTLKEMAERRANLAVRIASAIMKGADTAAVESKALELMDLDEAQLRATAATLKLVTADDDEDEEVVEEDEEDIEVEGSKKKKSAAVNARIDRLEASVGKLVTAMGNFFGMEDSMDEDQSQAVEMTGPDSGSMSEKELLAFLLSAEDMDGDGVEQNDPRYGYSEKKSDDPDEFERGEESEGTEEFDESEGDDMVEDEDADADADKEGNHYASDTDRMLKAMLDEMAAKKKRAGKLEEKDVEGYAKGPGIQDGQGGNVNPEPEAKTPVVEGPQTGGTAVKNADDQSPTDNDIQLTAGVDPMGLVDPIGSDKQANDELLALYQDLDLPKTAGDDQDEESDEDDDIGGGDTLEDMEELEEKSEEEGEEDAGKTAGVKLRPQPKKTAAGAKTLGNVQGGISKAARSEINELEKLWESAPDVSAVFGVPRS